MKNLFVWHWKMRGHVFFAFFFFFSWRLVRFRFVLFLERIIFVVLLFGQLRRRNCFFSRTGKMFIYLFICLLSFFFWSCLFCQRQRHCWSSWLACFFLWRIFLLFLPFFLLFLAIKTTQHNGRERRTRQKAKMQQEKNKKRSGITSSIHIN